MKKIVFRFVVASALLASAFLSAPPVAAQGSCPYPFWSGEPCFVAGQKCASIGGNPTAWAHMPRGHYRVLLRCLPWELLV